MTAAAARRRTTKTVTAAVIFLCAALTLAAAEPAPQRVVSINLCTDQMAMLMAAPGLRLDESENARVDEASRPFA